MYMRDILLDVIRPVDSSAIPADPQQPMCRCPDLVERSASPCADARTASVGDFSGQYRARIYELERLIEQLYDLLPERVDEAYDLVRAEYLAIHGPRS